MNKVKLKEAENNFIIRFPGGFSNPQMLELTKKHKVENEMAAANSLSYILPAKCGSFRKTDYSEKDNRVL